jgi:hypothetical protein
MSGLRFNPYTKFYDSVGNVILIVGKRYSGKTKLVKHLLTDVFGKKEYGFIFAGLGTISSESLVEVLLDTSGSSDISSQLNDELIEYVKQSTADCAARNMRSLIVLDDMLLSGMDVLNRMESLFRNAHDRKIDMIVTCNHPEGFPSKIRHYVNFIFAFREPLSANRERLQKYFTNFRTLEEFDEKHIECTQNVYDCMVMKKFQVGLEIFSYSVIGDVHSNFKNESSFACYDSIEFEADGDNIKATILAGPFLKNMACIITDSGRRLLCDISKARKISSEVRNGAAVTYLTKCDLTGILVMPGPDAFLSENIVGILQEISPEQVTVAWECIGHFDTQTYKFKKGFCFIRYSDASCQ